MTIALRRRERLQGRDRPGRGGALGIVGIAHPAALKHQLKPVRQPGKRRQGLDGCLSREPELPGRRPSRLGVRLVVPARQVQLERLVVGTEQLDPPRRFGRPARDFPVVPVEDQNVLRALGAENVLLRLGVFGQGAVAVEVVGLEVSHDGHVRGSCHRRQVGQLKARQFQHDHVIGADLAQLTQQAHADVAADVRFLCPRRMAPAIATVVDLPALPVIPTTAAGQRARKRLISVVISAPASLAAWR